MYEIPLSDGASFAPFFENTYDSCPEAFLQGVMGRGFCDNTRQPAYGIIQLGDFCFLGGNVTTLATDHLLSDLTQTLNNPNTILVPLSESWCRLLSEDASYRKNTRYAISKTDITQFDRNKLISYINGCVFDPDYTPGPCNPNYVIKPIDKTILESLQQQEWSEEAGTNYLNYEHFCKSGFGFVIADTTANTILSYASSFSNSIDSVEIEIATNPNYRNRGFATAVSARMILECIHREKRPSWDAANLTSVSVAKKMGYDFLKEYTSYLLPAN